MWITAFSTRLRPARPRASISARLMAGWIRWLGVAAGAVAATGSARVGGGDPFSRRRGFARTRTGEDVWQSSVKLAAKSISSAPPGRRCVLRQGFYWGYEGWNLSKCLQTGVCVAARPRCPATPARRGVKSVVSQVSRWGEYRGFRPRFRVCRIKQAKLLRVINARLRGSVSDAASSVSQFSTGQFLTFGSPAYPSSVRPHSVCPVTAETCVGIFLTRRKVCKTGPAQ